MMCWNGTEFLKLQDNDECSKQVTDNDETGDDETEDMENQGVEEGKGETCNILHGGYRLGSGRREYEILIAQPEKQQGLYLKAKNLRALYICDGIGG